MIRRSLLVLAAALLIPAAGQAQARLLLGAGLSNPNGDFSNQVESGVHGRVGLQIGVPVFPVSIRGEGELHNLPEAVGSESARLLNGTLSAVLSLGGIGLSPYVIAGVGSYRFSPSGDAESEVNRGLHGGFGASIGALGFGGFLEVRVVHMEREAGSYRYFPVTLGVRF